MPHHTGSTKLVREPLKYSGSLDEFKHQDLTPAIGREYPDVQLSELLSDDAKLRDLAITVSQRGVVFFRNQSLSKEEQKTLGSKLGELAGKPETSKLHRMPLSSKNNKRYADGTEKHDEEIFIISSEREKENHSNRFSDALPKLASYLWHSDITFENIPSDYCILKMTKLPDDVGGDTLWASAYDLYDRMSPKWQNFVEGLNATHYQPVFARVVKQSGDALIEDNRGSPENSGLDFKAVHPVVRTNPVTGWKLLFAAGQQIHDGKINDLTDHEGQILKDYFLKLITENHDLQVRFRWNVNDVAVWDNRSTYHSATMDYGGKREGVRVTSIGEKPYFDPNSLSKQEALRAVASQQNLA